MSETTPQGHAPSNGPIAGRVTRRALLTSAAAVGSAIGVAGLAGCTGNGDQPGPSGQQGGGAGTGPAGPPTSTLQSGVLYPDGYVGPKASNRGVIVTERAELTVVVPQDTQVGDWNTNKFSKWLEERTNVHVTYKEIAGSGSGSDTMTKINAMIASGDLPDAFLLSVQNTGGFTHSQMLLYGQQGTLIPLNDLIDKYCVETKRVFTDFPVTKQVLTEPDGNIYTLPNINDDEHVHTWVDHTFINKKWLDKLGLEMPQTIEDFENALKAFKNQDPNGNRSQDEVPFIGYTSTTPFDGFFMGSFMYNPGSPWLIMNGDQLDVAFRQNGWREGLKYMNRLYRQGLIDKRSFTQTGDQALVLGNKKPPVIGSINCGYWGGFIDIDQKDPKADYLDYVAVPTLQGPERIASWNYYSQYQIGNFVITSACKNPAVAAMWADTQLEMEAMLRQYIGAKDEAWEFAKVGDIGIGGQQAVYNYKVLWPPKPGEAWSQAGLSYRSSDYRLGERVDPKNVTFEKPLYEQTHRAYFPYRQPIEAQVPPLKLSNDQAGQIADLKVTIETYVTESLAKFVRGDMDPNDDGVWRKYLQTLDQMNLSTYLGVQQDALKAMKK